MRLVLRFLVAHILASLILQLFLIAWVVAAGDKLQPIRAVMATLFAPILIPLPIVRIGPMMRPIGYVIYCLIYLTLLTLAFLLLTRRARRNLRRLIPEKESAGNAN